MEKAIVWGGALIFSLFVWYLMALFALSII